MMTVQTPKGRWLNDKRTRVTCEYGVKGWWQAGYHTGVDLAVPGHTQVPVVWALRHNGRVAQVGGCGQPYGIHVLVRASKGRLWLFAHLSRLYVGLGDQVENGRKIGLTGSTGMTHPGDHLHLEWSKDAVWRYGQTRKPIVFDYDEARG